MTFKLFVALFVSIGFVAAFPTVLRNTTQEYSITKSILSSSSRPKKEDNIPSKGRPKGNSLKNILKRLEEGSSDHLEDDINLLENTSNRLKGGSKEGNSKRTLNYPENSFGNVLLKPEGCLKNPPKNVLLKPEKCLKEEDFKNALKEEDALGK